ncbi:unnamed protein product [Adineta steineri]|uniref:G-protein coupled receptors family 1 profile domain-containing protein n=1 Tax=Adineta steineri TaxID=433720 RepID=A0A815DFM3_9BILA|nr:unnamed protein product [Adineta steineri]CAF3836829.1 unnamed protein product [Adineta steineri]
MGDLIKFILILTFEIPAIFVSILIFLHFAVHHESRSKLKNHGWFILLLVNFIQLTVDLPMPMSFYYINRIWPKTNAYCVWWTWFEFSLNTIGLFLMSWISIQRHLFIFYPQTIFGNTSKKWILHILPIILCLSWTPLFYFMIVVLSPYCVTIWDFNSVICGIPCYFTANFIGQFDFIFNIAFPVMIIMFANVTLIIRVIYQKRSRHQTIHRQRHRRMVLQLWIVSSLYMACWLPMTITQLIQITLMPSFMIDQLETILFIVYFTPLLLPIICLSVLPELLTKIRSFIRKSTRDNRVHVAAFNGQMKRTTAKITIQ